MGSWRRPGSYHGAVFFKVVRRWPRRRPRPGRRRWSARRACSQYAEDDPDSCDACDFAIVSDSDSAYGVVYDDAYT